MTDLAFINTEWGFHQQPMFKLTFMDGTETYMSAKDYLEAWEIAELIYPGTGVLVTPANKSPKEKHYDL